MVYDFEINDGKYQDRNASWEASDSLLSLCGDRVIQLPTLARLTSDDPSMVSEFPVKEAPLLCEPYDRYLIRVLDTEGTELQVCVWHDGDDVVLVPVITGFEDGLATTPALPTQNGKARVLLSDIGMLRLDIFPAGSDQVIGIRAPKKYAFGARPALLASMKAMEHYAKVTAPSMLMLTLYVWVHTQLEWEERCRNRSVIVRSAGHEPFREKIGTPIPSGRQRIIDLGKKIVVYEGETKSRSFAGYHILSSQRSGHFRHYASGMIAYIAPTIVHYKKIAKNAVPGLTSDIIYRNTEDFLREKSYLEDEICRMFRREGLRFERERTFPWMGRKRLDFYLPELNTAVECQGVQHFYKYGDSDTDFSVRRQRDIDKKRECQEHGIRLLYYKNPDIPVPEDMQKDRYYTDPNDLLSAILRD